MKHSAFIQWGLPIVGALVVSAGAASLVSSQYFPLSKTTLDVRSGQVTFAQKCSGCHSNEMDGADKFGPGLAMIGKTAEDRKPNLTPAQYILESILKPDAFRAPGVDGHMPANTAEELSADELKNLVAYLAGLGQPADFFDVVSLDTQTRPTLASDPEHSVSTTRQGWELFSGKLGCSGCHSIYEIPGSNLNAPSLQLASQLSREYILESIREPGKVIARGYRQVTATNAAGESVTGRLIKETSDSWVILSRDSKGVYHTRAYPLTELQDRTLIEQSIMPPYSLDESDEEALLAFMDFLVAE